MRSARGEHCRFRSVSPICLRRLNCFTGAVLATLATFETWIADNKMPFFPAFTDHGTVHLERVMQSAESLFTEAGWKRLTPRNAGCTVLATLKCAIRCAAC